MPCSDTFLQSVEEKVQTVLSLTCQDAIKRTLPQRRECDVPAAVDSGKREDALSVGCARSANGPHLWVCQDARDSPNVQPLDLHVMKYLSCLSQLPKRGAGRVELCISKDPIDGQHVEAKAQPVLPEFCRSKHVFSDMAMQRRGVGQFAVP